ncbi:MAG: proton-conducting transporter membrane subunit [Flavobacteriales bacterium]
MELKYILASFVVWPLLLFLASLFISSHKEKNISRWAFIGTLLHLCMIVVFSIWWSVQGFPEINIKELALYQTENYAFIIDFYFDKVTAVYLFIGSFLTTLIVRYSRNYMHLEPGYKRFFNTILFFFASYNLTALSGNFETLFIGWEMLGISSFLLIAFYRNRYLPSRNALKVFSIYRIGDVGILLAMWASHHLYHENITFMKLNNATLVHQHLQGHSGIGLFISIAILIAAAVKSAQLPFSSWLPKAMEGPTPSSAIFYGSLSVHFGVFLLLRTNHFWGEQLAARVIIGMVGLLTAVLAYMISRVQSTIKTQIAYASISQIGVMFIEIASGFENLALVHFMGNAFFRTYQLLISPSVVAYKIRDMFYHYRPRIHNKRFDVSKRVFQTLYLLAIKEFYLDALLNKLIFRPVKLIGRKIKFIHYGNVGVFIIPLFAVGLWIKLSAIELNLLTINFIPIGYAFVGLVMVMKAFAERNDPRLSVAMVLSNHLFMAIGISFNEHFGSEHVIVYLMGIVPSALLAIGLLEYMKRKEPFYFGLNTYYGHVHEYRTIAFLFLLSILGLMGFPITPSFIGEDLIFSHIHEDQFLLAFFFASSYIISGIALVRVYARLLLGSHIKTTHPTAIKSA